MAGRRKRKRKQKPVQPLHQPPRYPEGIEMARRALETIFPDVPLGLWEIRIFEAHTPQAVILADLKESTSTHVCIGIEKGMPGNEFESVKTDIETYLRTPNKKCLVLSNIKIGTHDQLAERSCYF